VASLWEVEEAKAMAFQVREELEREGIPMGHVDLGIMIETPAAAILSGELAEKVDFFSIGWEHGDETGDRLFERLRFAGQNAEAKMFSATGGVNTHKGLIFASAILCGALLFLGFFEGDLQSVVAVRFSGLDLGNRARTSLNNRHSHGRTVSSEDAGHAKLATQNSHFLSHDIPR